ncbi:LLM class flavin-dependent oxidoreductase [Sulfidibacter corallicola]|uniref:LLM class flavin-dependent oxidoreductase n=1 Tax=Sulfidibacter corallicola TaxID=2818388 RepID=A0A8A4TRK2_SULCO|nr:MupA/Atu3671 family FMN-dependent luciferase-like monooxygenase [Sulfidibacter corallicola]QTD51648.1 LLM class flavin-dependent oxidoreductase [Sulfidibacter corallicola]
MADLQSRLSQLSPEKRRLLERRLAQKDRAHDPGPAPTKAPDTPAAAELPDLSVFFFSADARAEAARAYDFLIEAARLADRLRFKAIWTPERHFEDFGGLYPNPSVLNAALARETRHLGLRAGSTVLPLHGPVRVAEEWALVDNLSGGRVGLSFATGWHDRDYVIRPENYADRRELMFRGIEQVRALWRGETVPIPGVGGREVPVRTLPRPIQPELPVWVTASSERTWRRAAAMGANILTSLIGITFEQLTESIHRYRQERAQNGFDPTTGVVTVMVHTFVGENEAETREMVRDPMKSYLSQFVAQLGSMAASPQGSAETEDLDSVLEFAFARYFDHFSLLGTADKCARVLAKLSKAGADEAACLIDFGLAPETVLTGLERLAAIRGGVEVGSDRVGSSV